MSGLRIETVDNDICVYIPRSFWTQLFDSPQKFPSDNRPCSTKITGSPPTLKSSYIEYLKARTLRPSTLVGYNRIVDKYLKDWHDIPLTEITDISFVDKCSEIRKTSGVAQAAFASRVFKAIYSFAAFRYKFPPTDFSKALRYSGLALHSPRKRSYIPAHKINVWLSSVLSLSSTREEQTARDIFLLGIFLGLRKKEIMTLEWGDVDLEERKITLRNTKNHKDHVLPLCDFLVQRLRVRKKNVPGLYVFPGKTGRSPVRDIDDMRLRVIQLSEVSFTLHDLRRTFATIASDLGIPPYTIKRILNHSSSGDVTAGYVVHTVDSLRDTMEKIGKEITKNVGPAKRKEKKGLKDLVAKF